MARRVKSAPPITDDRMGEAVKMFRFIKPYRWTFFAGMVLLFFGSGIFMIFPAAAGEMANIASGEGRWGFTLNQLGLLLFGILIIQSILSYFRLLLFAKVSEKGMAAVRGQLYTKLVTLNIPFFEKQRVGELTSRITTDVMALQSIFSVTLAEFFRQIIILILGIFWIIWFTGNLALYMLASFPLVIVGAIYFGKFIRKISKRRQELLAESNVIVEESMQNIRTVKAFTNERYESNRYSNALTNVVTIGIDYAKKRGIFTAFIFIVLFGCIFFIIWKGAVYVQEGLIPVGDLFSFILYTTIIGGAIAGLGNFYTEIIGGLGATERIRELLEMDSEISLDTSNDVAKLKGSIAFEKVDFSYPTRANIQVLTEINLEAKHGEQIALVGMSGSGKSTIAQLLLRFYDVDAGVIKFDGIPVGEYPLETIRKNIAIVPQEVILFGGTIRENISYGKPHATDAEIIEAAKKANAWEFIIQFPEQLETVVGERGVKLSGGQKQRVAIARAILKDPAILILDEATSSLDAESELEVQKALQILMQGRTSIVIAHRLSTIRNADQIYVLQRGKIIERGTHEQLISNDQGVYATLAGLQSFEIGEAG